MKLFKKLIVGAILGLSLCVGLFFTNDIKTNASMSIISPNDLMGVAVQPNTNLTMPYYNSNITQSVYLRYSSHTAYIGIVGTRQFRYLSISNGTTTGNQNYTYLAVAGQRLINENGTSYNFSTLDFYTNNNYNLEFYDATSGGNLIDNTSPLYAAAIEVLNNYFTTAVPQVSITLNANGGEIVNDGTGDVSTTATITANQGEVNDAITNYFVGATIQYPGHTFLGWNTNASATSVMTTGQINGVTSGTTLYAIWQDNSKAWVRYEKNPNLPIANYTGSTPTSEQVSKNSTYAPVGNTGGLAYPHYHFIGWNTNANATTGLSSVSVGNDDITLYSIFEIDTYTLTLNLQGGSITGGTTRTYDYNTQVNLNTLGTPLKVGFIFLGWGLTADATSYISTITMTTNKTIYAIWGTATNDLATITYYSNGATSGYVPSSQQVVKGTQYNVEGNPGNLEREGYIFIGWGTTADATTPITTLYPSTDFSLYAIWSQLQYSTGNIYINNVLICELRIYNGSETTFETGFYNFGANYFTMTLNPQNGLEVVDYNSNYIWSIVDGYITYTFNGEYFMNITIQSTRNNYVETLTKTQMQPIYSNNTPYENGGTINYYITIDGSNDDIDNFRNVVGNIFNSVQTLLNVQIGWFSMGGIIAIVLAIGVMFFIFKIARGGGNS